MLNIQQMLKLTEHQRFGLKRTMNQTGFFDPAGAYVGRETGIFSIFDEMDYKTAYAIKESMRAIPLREFLAKSGTTGMQGAAYLVPDKVHQDIVFYSSNEDKVPLISGLLVSDFTGESLKVPVGRTLSMTPYKTSSGGSIASAHINADTQLTLKPVTMAMNIDVGGTFMDDHQFSVIEWQVHRAAEGFGRMAMDDAMDIMCTSTDGYGTLNTEGASADETSTLDIYNAIDANAVDRHISDTLIITPEAWTHDVAVGIEVAGGAAGDYWKPAVMTGYHPIAQGFHAKFDTLDVLFSTSPKLHDDADLVGAAFTACDSLVFTRGVSLVTARKRWLRVENYANPVADLKGAVITGAQDCATAYDDSICRVRET